MMLSFQEFLTEAAKAEAWHQAHPISHYNIIDHFKQATTPELHQGLTWYKRANITAKQIATDTGHSITTMAGLISNYSPQTEWKTNLHLASRVAKSRQGIGGKDQEAYEGKKAFAGEIRKTNANRILKGEHYSNVLSGRKVNHFAHLIEYGGDKDPKKPHVAIDRHAWSVATGARMPDYAFKVPGPKKYNSIAGAYIHAANHINKQARESGDSFRIAPHQLQAVTWLVRQRRNNEEDQAAAVQTMVKKGGSWLPGMEPTKKDLPNQRVRVDKARGGSSERWTKYAKANHPRVAGLFEGKKRINEAGGGIRRPRKPGQLAYGVGGRDYESQIVKNLQKHNLMNRYSVAAGSSANAPDAHLLIRKQGAHNLEVKGTKGAMFGQLELAHNGKSWDISPRAEARYPKTAAAVRASGFINDINKKWKNAPTNYDADLKQGNVYKLMKGTSTIAAHYHHDRRTPYIQIGKSGLYHFKQDPAGIGSSPLSGDTQLRARFKNRKTHSASGQTSYGGLIVMSLRNPKKSDIDLDNPEHIKALGVKHGIKYHLPESTDNIMENNKVNQGVPHGDRRRKGEPRDAGAKRKLRQFNDMILANIRRDVHRTLAFAGRTRNYKTPPE